MGRILHLLNIEYDLVSVNGGLKQNAIPRECDGIIAINHDDLDKFNANISEIQKRLEEPSKNAKTC